MSETLRELQDSGPTSYRTFEMAKEEESKKIVEMNHAQFQNEQEYKEELHIDQLIGNEVLRLIDMYPIDVLNNAA